MCCRYDIFAGLTSEEYLQVRSHIIEYVLATDLTTHFDFIARLKTLAAARGHTAFAASNAVAAGTPRAPSADASSGALMKRRASLDLSKGTLDLPAALSKAPSHDETRLSKRRLSISKSLSQTSNDAHAPGDRPMRRARAASTCEGGEAQQGQASRGTKGMCFAGTCTSVGETDEAPPPTLTWTSPFLDADVDVRLVLTTAVKFADLNHATKPEHLHREWSRRITDEVRRPSDLVGPASAKRARAA
jgi:hypothetical protein